jgi:hypothetical protein
MQVNATAMQSIFKYIKVQPFVGLKHYIVNIN